MIMIDDCDDNGDDVHGFPASFPCGLGTPTRDDDSDDSPLGRTGCLQVTTTEEFVIRLVETFNGALGTEKSP